MRKMPFGGERMCMSTMMKLSNNTGTHVGKAFALVCASLICLPASADGSLASALPIGVKMIDADGESVELNIAYNFQVWSGERPDFPADEDGDFRNLRDYLEERGDVARLNRLDWIVDFVIRFDRDVSVGDVALYGQLDPLFPDWINFNEISRIPALAANEEFRLLNFDFITYGLALEALENFNCGVSSRLCGTTITVELKLYNPNDRSECETIAGCSYKFVPQNQGSWFDTHVESCAQWPRDADLAFGGYWGSHSLLAAVASVEGFGCLGIHTDRWLDFVVTEDRMTGKDLCEVTMELDLESGAFEVDNLPAVASDFKGGVILVCAADGLRYYGLAKVGTTNKWVELDGPSAANEDDKTHLEMVFQRSVDGVIVKYVINGTGYRYGGKCEIPIIVAEPIKSVSCVGTGALYSLFASAAERKRGMLLLLK